MKVITLVVLFGILDKTDKAHISILKIFYKKKSKLNKNCVFKLSVYLIKKQK